VTRRCLTLRVHSTKRTAKNSRRVSSLGYFLPIRVSHYAKSGEEFEVAETPDARFAKALDRLQPILLNHIVGGGTWTDYNVDENRERSLTQRIADGSPVLWTAAEAAIADAVANGRLRPPVA
jgi:HD domain